jgi:hypothetical protein
MTRSRPVSPAPSMAMRVAAATGRALATAVQVFGATLNAVSGSGNASLLPPDPARVEKRSDHRP